MQTIYFCYALVLTGALLISFLSVPSLIQASIKHQIFDSTDLYRKTHKGNISRLGGISIFCAFIIAAIISVFFTPYSEAYILILCCLVVLALGVKDDVYGGTSPRFKFLVQFIAAFILVTVGDFRLSSLYGVFGIWEMNAIWGAIFSIALIIFLNNAVNLIDGIDGLAASVGLLASFTFGMLFAYMDETAYALISFSLCGGILGFLRYNWHPAKIFMGDTGALIIGLTTGVLAIKFIELNNLSKVAEPYFFTAPAKAVAILIIPIFDSLRIFTVRILRRQSPFKGDRNHIHHRLEQIGLKPNQIVPLLIAVNISIMLFAVVFSELGNFVVMILIMLICMLFNWVLTTKIKKSQQVGQSKHIGI